MTQVIQNPNYESVLDIIIIKFKPVFLNPHNTSLKGDAHHIPQRENIPL